MTKGGNATASVLALLAEVILEGIFCSFNAVFFSGGVHSKPVVALCKSSLLHNSSSWRSKDLPNKDRAPVLFCLMQYLLVSVGRSKVLGCRGFLAILRNDVLVGVCWNYPKGVFWGTYLVWRGWCYSGGTFPARELLPWPCSSPPIPCVRPKNSKRTMRSRDCRRFLALLRNDVLVAVCWNCWKEDFGRFFSGAEVTSVTLPLSIHWFCVQWIIT